MAAGWLPQPGRPTGVGEGFYALVQHEHRHSRIRFVTPSERHRNLDHQILARRHELYEQARKKSPERWSGQTRNWEPV